MGLDLVAIDERAVGRAQIGYHPRALGFKLQLSMAPACVDVVDNDIVASAGYISSYLRRQSRLSGQAIDRQNSEKVPDRRI